MMKVITSGIGVPVREEPGNNTKYISRNETADVIDEYSDYITVKYDGDKRKRIYSRLVSSGLKIRDAKDLFPDINAGQIDQPIPIGTSVIIEKTEPIWYKLKFKGGTIGWAHKGKLKFI